MRISLLLFILMFVVSCKTETELINTTKSEKFTRSFHEGLRLKLLGNYDKALELFNTCLKEEPNDDASHFAIAQISLIKGNLEQAKRHTTQAAALDHSNIFYQIELGYMYRETGEYEKSANVFEEILNERPTNSNYYFESALSWELSGNVKKAISLLNMLEESVGMRVEASLKKHHWYKGLTKLGEAELELTRILEVQENNQYVIATLVDFYLNTGQIEPGMNYLNRLVELDSKNGMGLILLAQFEFERQNIGKAKEYYSRAILSESLKASEVEEALKFFIHYEDSTHVKSVLKVIEKSYFDNDTVMMFIGDVYLEDKNFEKSLNCYEKATTINPGSYSNWERVLYVLYDSQQWERLIKNGKRVLKTFPLKTLPYYMLSVSFNQTNQFRLAQQYAKEGLITVDDDAVIKSDLYGQVAESYFGLKLFLEAKKEYLKAIDMGKNYENDYLKFNFCLRLYENNIYLDLALGMLDEMINKIGTNFDLKLLKGDVFFKKELFNKALIMYKSLLETKLNEAIVNERLGDVYAKLNNIKEAIVYWKIAAQIGPGSELLDKKIINEAYFE